MAMKKIAVRDILNRDVETVGPDTSAEEVASKMKSMDLGAVPVCEGAKILGTIEDRDFTLRLVAEGRDPSTTRARDVMNPDFVSCREDDDVDAVTRLMEGRGVHRVFAVDAGRHLRGMISLGKIARAESEKTAGHVIKTISRPPKRRRAS